MATKKKAKKPTQEEITQALKEITQQKKNEAGVIKHVEKPQVVPTPKELLDMEQQEVPLEWSSIFNVLTRIYETNEDSYNHVYYNKEKDSIIVIADTLDENKEVGRIRTQLCCDGLKYTSCKSGDNVIINICKA